MYLVGTRVDAVVDVEVVVEGAGEVGGNVDWMATVDREGFLASSILPYISFLIVYSPSSAAIANTIYKMDLWQIWYAL